MYKYSNVNRLFLHVIYHLDNTFMSYDPFYSVDVRADICNQNAIFNLFFRNTGHRLLQVNYVFSTKRQQVGDSEFMFSW